MKYFIIFFLLFFSISCKQEFTGIDKESTKQAKKECFRMYRNQILEEIVLDEFKQIPAFIGVFSYKDLTLPHNKEDFKEIKEEIDKRMKGLTLNVVKKNIIDTNEVNYSYICGLKAAISNGDSVAMIYYSTDDSIDNKILIEPINFAITHKASDK